MALTDVYGETDPDDALRTLHHAVDAGVTFIDTADVYGKPREGVDGPAGTNEELVGGCSPTGATRCSSPPSSASPGQGRPGRHARGDAATCAAPRGLAAPPRHRRHRPLLHAPAPARRADRGDRGRDGRAGREGKVRHLGLSEVTAAELRAAAAVHPIAAVQSEWSIWSRDVEAQVVPAAREVGAGFVPYSPLGRGFLTGAVTAERVAGRCVKAAAFRRRLRRQPAGRRGRERGRRRGRRHPGAGRPRLALRPRRAARAAGRADPRDPSAQRVDENLGALDVTLGADQCPGWTRRRPSLQGGRNLSKDPAWISSGRE